MLRYSAILPGLSSAHVRYLSQLIAAHRRSIGCRWRRLTPGRQAMLVLVHLRCGSPYAHLAASFGVVATTCYRYTQEAVTLLAAQTPNLDTVLTGRRGATVTVLDGTIIPTWRVRCTAEHKRWWVHRKRTYGVNLQALCDQAGNLLWISPGTPGATHDLTAARHHQIIATAGRCRVRLLADRGYQGAGPEVITPVKADSGKPLIPAIAAYNRRHAAKRAPGERGFATLKTWHILDRIRCTVTKTGAIAQAILAIHHATSTPIRLQ